MRLPAALRCDNREKLASCIFRWRRRRRRDWGNILVFFRGYEALCAFAFGEVTNDVAENIAQRDDTEQSAFLSALLLFLLKM